MKIYGEWGIAPGTPNLCAEWKRRLRSGYFNLEEHSFSSYWTASWTVLWVLCHTATLDRLVGHCHHRAACVVLVGWPKPVPTAGVVDKHLSLADYHHIVGTVPFYTSNHCLFIYEAYNYCVPTTCLYLWQVSCMSTISIIRYVRMAKCRSRGNALTMPK